MKTYVILGILISYILGLFMALLGSDNKTADDGTVTIPEDCVYVVAVSIGTENPPYLNGNLMQTKGSVPATGQLSAISCHVSTFPTHQELPFVMNGASRVVWFFLDDAVCTRPVPVSGYSATGQVTGTLDTSTNDIVICVVLGSNGQVLLTGDTVSATLIYDSTTCRIGYLIPGDSSMSCDASDEDVTSGYWYYPPSYYTDTSSSVLVTPGHYQTTAVYNRKYYAYAFYNAVTYPDYPYRYTQFTYVNPPGTTTQDSPAGAIGSSSYDGQQITLYEWYTYHQVWVPPVYETQTSGYWTYPDPVWVETGVPGEISCIFISIADTAIGSIHVNMIRC
jgi:hypothetical protein